MEVGKLLMVELLETKIQRASYQKKKKKDPVGHHIDGIYFENIFKYLFVCICVIFLGLDTQHNYWRIDRIWLG